MVDIIKPTYTYCSSDIDEVSIRVQELVEKINHRRTSDQKVMDSFEEKLIEKVSSLLYLLLILSLHSVADFNKKVSFYVLPEMKDVCQQMKEQMYVVYEENSNEMQVKLQDLSEVLERCTKLNNELIEANRALGHLREGQTSEV